jgi:hypothetical protein
MKPKKTVTRNTPKGLTRTPLIEVRQIDRRNRRIDRLVTPGRRSSVQFSRLRGHFFTAK